MKHAARWIAGVLTVVAGVLVIRGCGAGKDSHAEHKETPGAQHAGSDPGERKTPLSSGKSRAVDPLQALDLAHQQMLENPSSASDILADLRTALFQGDQETSARAVSAFLRSHRDTPTGMGFAVGPDGVLAAAPTLRAALLNWHPTLDPLVALEMAREILKTTDSADEYAVALRNLAWNDLDGDMQPELTAAFQNLLGRDDWRKAPSAGYLESFDVAVELGDALTFQHLADFAVPDANDATLVRAANMSMDRMILRNPGHLTNSWNADPQWMDRAPLQRASLLSRLDITREDHRSVLLDYLSSDRITPEERSYFEKIYPNGNHLHGHRLITTTEKSPTIDQRAAIDRVILHTIDGMMANSPAAAEESLRNIRGRLAAFVQQ